MFANCFVAGDFQYNGPAAYWLAPMLRRKTDGTAASIPLLKKSPLATLGAPLHRRSQLPARLYAPRHLEPHRVPTGNPRNRRTQEREDSRRHRTLVHGFDYRQETVFNATTYLGFLEQLARPYRRQGAILIQDNASYHKDAEVWKWFKSNRHWLEVHQLPPYSPELNPTGKTVAAHPQERNTQ